MVAPSCSADPMTQELRDQTTDVHTMLSPHTWCTTHDTLFLFVRMAVVTPLSLYISGVLPAALDVEGFRVYQVVGNLVTAFGFVSRAIVAAA